MTRLRTWFARTSMAFRQSGVEHEMEEEIRSHLEMAAEDYRREGIGADDALQLARRNFGGVDQTKERYRDLYRFASVEAFLHDVRFGLGTLRKSPGFSALAIAMLALGIGINAAVFTVVNAALFKGWPLVRRNDRIVQITTNKYVSYADFLAWQSQAKSFKGEVALLQGRFHTLTDGAGTPASYFATDVTANMFHVLGVRPILGRGFLPADGDRGAEPVIILRYNVWVRRFGANPAVIGHTVRVDGAPARIVGVMPKGFSFPWPMVQDFWMPPPPGLSKRDTLWGGPYAFARLAEGVSVEKARAEMEVIGRRLESAYPATNRGVVPVVKSFDEWFVGGDTRVLYKVMWGAVCFVLLIVCANVANLLVERAMGRSHEISLRLALGAGRRRIIRQFLAESLTLAMLGGAIGWWIAKACVGIYVLAQVNEDVLNFAMDQRVAMWLIAISVGAGLLTGIASASYLTRLKIHAVIRDDAQGIAGGRRGARLSGIFVAAEMVLAVILLASAGVIVRSFLNVYTADVGVNTANILALSNPDLQPERYPTAATWVPYYRDLVTRLEALPDVESVGLGAIPVSDPRPGAYELADAQVVEEESRPTVANFPVDTGYFRTLGIRVLSGREFNDSDRGSSARVAIVSRKFAEQNWPGELPVGKRLRLFRGNSGKEPTPWLTVVGVVSDIVQNDRTRRIFTPLVYIPYLQEPSPFMAVMVRTAVAPERLIEPIRRQLYAIDPNVPIPVLMLPLGELLDRNWAFERNTAVLLGVFAAVALLLAAVGMYAAVSHSVRRRVQEFGVRVAVGATGREIVGLVFRRGVPPVVTGLVVGLAAAFAINRLLRAQLVGVSPADPAALLTASVVLVLSAALGCWIPARRATRVDPAIALRRE